jgi:hypothetical protein
MLTQLNLVLPDAVDVHSALRFTLSILLGQLFVKVHLAGLEFVNPLQSSRREPASSEILQTWSPTTSGPGT